MHSVPSSLAWAHPLIQDWFVQKFGTPTEPQEQGWPHILAGRTTLISAPTGSGKTLAAFLACIDRLVRKALTGDIQDRTEVLYISPLKALGNDIQKNLEVPLGEILQMAGERGLLMPEIRVAVRTGDTLMHERRAMLNSPPHIQAHIQDSLYIQLTAERRRAILLDVETVIVEETHAVEDDKRGAALTLSPERLEALTNHPPARIGLSATQKPIEEVAHFLTGSGRRDPVIVNVGHKRDLDLAVDTPASQLGPVASNEMWDEIYDRIAELVRQHRSTLVFVNTRRLAERVAHHLAERLGEEAVAAHHGSLSRKLRLAAEKKLKNGEISVLVATASLELGIDIGTVDLVCQLSSTRAIAVALQRVGRSGHWRGAVPKGRIFAMTRDDLLECAALVRAIRQGDLDRLMIPESPLDVLAQQIVASCAAEEWREADLFALIRRAYPYRNLPREVFDSIVVMLSDGIAARRGRYGAYLYRDQVNGRLRARRGSRLAAITSGGAIPETALYTVVAEPEGVTVGTVDEDFAVESLAGDVMLLGNTSWRIRRIEGKSGRVIVEDAQGAPPGVPFWLGEAPARTAELSAHLANLRQEISDRLPGVSPVGFSPTQPVVAETISWLKEECGLDDAGAEQIVEYILQGRAVLGAVPTQETIIAERFFDEGGGMQLVIHAPFGGRINKAWGLALRKRFCRSFNFELQAAATDNGLNIALAEQHSFPLADVFQFLQPETVQPILEQAALASPIFGTRWRWDATRALALLRFQGGKKIPPQIQRMRSDDLLASVFPDVAACQENIVGDIQIPDHPLVSEVMKDVLTEAMDIDGLHDVLQTLIAVPESPGDVVIPSGRDRQEPALSGQESSEGSRRDLARSGSNAWSPYFSELTHEGRATVAMVEGETLSEQAAGRRRYWVAAEKVKSFTALFPSANFETTLAEIGSAVPSKDDALLALLTGWMAHLGPTTAAQLGGLLGLPAAEIDKALLRLEASGAILRGKFTDPSTSDTEWCNRRLLARIHRLTLGTLRKQIEPVTAAQFMRWLLRWQHIASGTQVLGERGTLEVLRQLQGFEVPANAWERQILARRIADYDPKIIDQLCLTGAVGWGRLSPHPATLEDTAEGKRRVIPTSVAPITFFVREEADWMMPRHSGTDLPEETPGLSHGAREVLDFLRHRGASFFADIVRGTEKLKAEIETALWELVAAGIVTADGFDNLRSLIDPKRRAGQGHGRTSRPRHSAGRWSLLYTDQIAERNKAVEATCWMLLKRYGVVFRDLLVRETILPKWRELQIAFRRLEDRGEIRGGRFVDGFLGEQFALPVAVESLRAARKVEPTGETLTLSAADPLNLVGILVPGERVPAISGKTVSFRDGVAVRNEDAYRAAGD